MVPLLGTVVMRVKEGVNYSFGEVDLVALRGIIIPL